MGKITTVNEYLAEQTGPVCALLEQLRRNIRLAAPMAEEVISYGIPTYKQHGPLVHFAAFKGHCSLVIINKDIIQLLASDLERYATSGTTIHFTVDKPLPAALVKKILKIRMLRNEELALMKKA